MVTTQALCSTVKEDQQHSFMSSAGACRYQQDQLSVKQISQEAKYNIRFKFRLALNTETAQYLRQKNRGMLFSRFDQIHVTIKEKTTKARTPSNPTNEQQIKKMLFYNAKIESKVNIKISYGNWSLDITWCMNTYSP